MISGIAVRLARPEDQPALNDIMRRASLAAETGEVLRRLIAEPEHLQVDGQTIAENQVVLAEVDGQPVGIASFLLSGNDYAELDGMFVDPAFWRRGIATLLFEAVEREVGSRQAGGIRVVAGESAVPFYQSVGFEVVGEEQTPLGPVVPVMMKAL